MLDKSVQRQYFWDIKRGIEVFTAFVIQSFKHHHKILLNTSVIGMRHAYKSHIISPGLFSHILWLL